MQKTEAITFLKTTQIPVKHKEFIKTEAKQTTLRTPIQTTIFEFKTIEDQTQTIPLLLNLAIRALTIPTNHQAVPRIPTTVRVAVRVEATLLPDLHPVLEVHPAEAAGVNFYI